MAQLRKLASQTLLYGFTYFAGRLLNFFLTPFYTRVFDNTADYGAISEIYSYITFFTILYAYGIETGFFYFANKKDELPKEVAGTSFLTLLFSSALFTGVLLLLTSPLAYYTGYPEHKDFITYAILILCFDTLAVIPFAYLRKEDRAVRFASLKLLNIVITIILNIVFIVGIRRVLQHGHDDFLYHICQKLNEFTSPVGMVFLSNLIASVITFLLLLPEVFSFRLKWDSVKIKQILIYSWPLLILGFAGMINETLDRVILKRMLQLPPQNMSLQQALGQVGIYSACYKLSIFMTLAIQSFRYAAEPFFFSMMKQEDAKEIFARVLKYFVFVTSLIFLVIMFFIPLILEILGKNYRGAVEVVPILLAANLFLGIFYYLSQWYKQTEKTIYGAYISIGGAVITILINLIFIPYYGYMASAWATLICYAAMAVVSYILGQKYYPVPYHISNIAAYLMLAFLYYFISLYIQKNVFHYHEFEWGWGMYFIHAFLLLTYILNFFRLEEIPIKSITKILRRNA